MFFVVKLFVVVFVGSMLYCVLLDIKIFFLYLFVCLYIVICVFVCVVKYVVVSLVVLLLRMVMCEVLLVLCANVWDVLGCCWDGDVCDGVWRMV